MNGAAVTIGKFNGFHLGHQVLLDSVADVAEKEGYDAYCIKLVFSNERIFTAEEEQEIFRDKYDKMALECISFTPEFASQSPEDFVRTILVDKYNVKYISVGKDFRFGKDRAGDTDVLAELGIKYGFEVRVFDKLCIGDEVVSSTRIKEKMASGDMEEASRLLGRPYSIAGIVEGGKKLGRSLGYPTINQKFASNKILPLFGVYSSDVLVYNSTGDFQKYKGITNIGIRPSVNDGDVPTVETFIYNFSEDIYGYKVKIIPKVYIRPERHFNSLEELTEQISRDTKYADSL